MPRVTLVTETLILLNFYADMHRKPRHRYKSGHSHFIRSAYRRVAGEMGARRDRATWLS